MKRAEDENESKVLKQVDLARSGNCIKFESFGQAMQFVEDAQKLGIEMNMNELKLQIGNEGSKNETLAAAA